PYRDRAHRGHRFLLEHRAPRGPQVAGLERAAGAETDVEGGGALLDRREIGDAAAHVGRPHGAPREVLEERGLERDRGCRLLFRAGGRGGGLLALRPLPGARRGGGLRRGASGRERERREARQGRERCADAGEAHRGPPGGSERSPCYFTFTSSTSNTSVA